MEFKNYSFKDLLENIVDNRGKTCPVESVGIPLIATNCIKDDSLYAEYERVRYISDETYKTWFRGHPEPEDIIFVCKGSPGRIAWVQSPVSYCIAQDMVAIRANKSVINSKFLFALLRSPQTQKSILNMHVGTMIPHFKKGDFSNLYFDIPCDLAYQKWAGELYFSFSEKIELNKKTNQTLEQMAQALFKSWFVDFDPVFDNMLAKADFKLENLDSSLPSELVKKAKVRLLALNGLAETDKTKASLTALAQKPSSQTTASKDMPCASSMQLPTILPQHATTHAHFPSEFEHNEQLGWIPKGWDFGSLASVAKFTSNRIQGNKLTLDNYISTDNMSANKNGVTKASKFPEVKSAPAYSSGHILVSNIRPYFKKIWFASSSGGRSNDVLGFEAIEPKSKEYLLNLLYQDVFFDYMMATSKGSKMPRGDKKAIMDWEVVIPPSDIQQKYSILVQDFHRAIPLRNKESDILIELRDKLLPKLISGEIALPENQLG